MADPRDARIAELEGKLAAAEAAQQAAEEERDALRQVDALLDSLLARQREKRRVLPSTCSLCTRLA
jgi:hypothetical protein